MFQLWDVDGSGGRVMREIKFRVYSNQLNKTVYPNENGWFEYSFIGKNLATQHCRIDLALQMNGNELEVMQYTGLKDKNGKEIYEGDIVKFIMRQFEGEFLGVVKFEDAMFRVSLVDKEQVKRTNIAYEDFTYYNAIKFEVIGNKFENPNLLEVK